MDNTLPKNEIVSGKADIGVLMNKGRWGTCGNIRFCFLFRPEGSGHRIMVSVPKRYFKRAVKRNLLKRRIRESYRTQKEMLATDKGVDVLFFYNTREVLDFSTIKTDIAGVLAYITSKA